MVTYHPGSEVVAENIARLRPQVQTLIVVDNGSPEAALSALRTASDKMKFLLVENGSNLGLGAALNIGVAIVEKMGADFVAIFDQDSTVTEGFIGALCDCYQRDTQQDTLAIVVPVYRDRSRGIVLPASYSKSGGLQTAMSSGSFISTALFGKLGLFEETLFLDGTDYEFSLRARSQGYRIEECTGAVLIHSPASPHVLTICGKALLTTSNYSRVRRYYAERNKLLIARRYWRKYPRFVLRECFYSLKEWAKVVLVEDDKAGKLHGIALGIVDGVAGVSGKCRQWD